MESIVCVCVEGFPQWNQFSQIVKPHVAKPQILLTGRLEKCVCVCVCLEKCVCVCVSVFLQGAPWKITGGDKNQ